MEIEHAVRLRGTINRLARQLNTSATDEGLTPTQASVLGLVAGRPGVTVSDLLALEHVNASTLSRIIGRLTEMGLVVRTPTPDDLRSASLQVTGHGRAVHDRIRDQRARLIFDAVARMPERDRATLVAAIPPLEVLAGELGATAAPQSAS